MMHKTLIDKNKLIISPREHDITLPKDYRKAP